MKHAYKIYAHFSTNDHHPQQGTGFFVKSPNTGETYFLTNAHVVLKNGKPMHSGLVLNCPQGQFEGYTEVEYIAHQYKEQFHTDSISKDTNQLYTFFGGDIAVLKVTSFARKFKVHSLKFNLNPCFTDEAVTISGFPKGVFKSIKGRYYATRLQAHFVGQKTLDCGGSGSPVLNKKNEVVGIMHSTIANNANYLMVMETTLNENLHFSCTEPDEIANPIQGICMPSYSIESFLRTCPHINW